MRKFLMATMASATMGAALLAGGAGAASAAPVPSTQVATVQASPDTVNAYEYYTWYWTQPNCENAGAALQVRGVISNYYCQQSGYTTWYLYVQYR
ncbi:hypothetical protein OHA70_36205 [Kribbella sp. NBC_00382]|uniref:hypothetical protein n=1 Tax=Kribbella sp. NBC_00382 TaxID=2975967 RepID=UPI002E24C395